MIQFRKTYGFQNCFNNNIVFHLPPTSNHLHPIQVEKCDSNSRLVVEEGDNGKSRLEKIKVLFRLYMVVFNLSVYPLEKRKLTSEMCTKLAKLTYILIQIVQK